MAKLFQLESLQTKPLNITVFSHSATNFLTIENFDPRNFDIFLETFIQTHAKNEDELLGYWEKLLQVELLSHIVHNITMIGRHPTSNKDSVPLNLTQMDTSSSQLPAYFLTQDINKRTRRLAIASFKGNI